MLNSNLIIFLTHYFASFLFFPEKKKLIDISCKRKFYLIVSSSRVKLLLEEITNQIVVGGCKCLKTYV